MTSLSLDQQQEEDEEYNDLDERILSIVSECKNHEIRPAKLAAELGMSVDDACAQLCGLLAAVGEGSSFEFQNQVMVFTFPPDFAKRARRFQRRQTCKDRVYTFLIVCVKLIKLITAFGLILSLLIVSIAAMVGLVAAIIAMSRSGNHGGAHHRAALVQRLRGMFYTTRQLLWCYAMFGNSVMPGQDPFLQEIAYDLALFSSMCCGNPGSIFFWMRASQLSQRRRRNGQRGWARNRINTQDLEGVALVQRGTWGRRDQDDAEPSQAGGQEEPFRGLLSVSVEFLFGPTPFVPGPTESEKHKLRAAVIVQHCSEKAGQGISLQDLSPYIDSPPASLQHETAIVSEGLVVVSHFNGKPAEVADLSSHEPSKACFVFPELLAESASVIKYEEPPDFDDGSWEYLCYAGNDAQLSSQATTSGGRTTGGSNMELPSSLQESRYVLTRLEKKQFQQCVVLGILNFIGVYWLQQSLEPEGVLDLQNMAGTFAAAFLQKGLVPILRFYSILFFVLPLARLILILGLNTIRGRRNRRRADFAYALSQSPSSASASS